MNETTAHPASLEKNPAHHPRAIRLFVIADPTIDAGEPVRMLGELPHHQVVSCSAAEHNCFEKFCDAPADVVLVGQATLEQRARDIPLDALFADFRNAFPRLRFMIFGEDIAGGYVRRMLRAGVHGFIDAHTPPELLAAAIREVHKGGFWVGRKVLEQLIYSTVEMDRIIERGIRDKINNIDKNLTARETQVLQHVLDGLSTKQIAADLALSEQSVKFHLNSLFRKFEVTHRGQLLLMAFQRVCPVNGMIKLYRAAQDRHSIARGKPPVIEDPLADDICQH